MESPYDPENASQILEKMVSDVPQHIILGVLAGVGAGLYYGTEGLESIVKNVEHYLNVNSFQIDWSLSLIRKLRGNFWVDRAFATRAVGFLGAIAGLASSPFITAARMDAANAAAYVKNSKLVREIQLDWKIEELYYEMENYAGDYFYTKDAKNSQNLWSKLWEKLGYNISDIEEIGKHIELPANVVSIIKNYKILSPNNSVNVAGDATPKPPAALNAKPTVVEMKLWVRDTYAQLNFPQSSKPWYR